MIQELQYIPLEPVCIQVVDALLEDALCQAKKMQETGEADVFVSAGGNAKLLAQNLRTPFVEIKVTGFDILLALKKAKKYSDRIGVVTYGSKIPYLDEVAEMLTVSIKQVSFSNWAIHSASFTSVFRPGTFFIVSCITH